MISDLIIYTAHLIEFLIFVVPLSWLFVGLYRRGSA